MRLPQLLTILLLSCGAGPSIPVLQAAGEEGASEQELDRAIDEILLHADSTGPIILAMGGHLAMDRERFEDAAFFIWAAQLRAQMESGPPPSEQRMMNAREYTIGQVLGRESPPIEREIQDHPDAYAAAVESLSQWTPVFGEDVLYSIQGPKPAPPEDFVAKVGDVFLRDLRISSALLQTPDWKEAKDRTGHCIQSCCPRSREATVQKRRIELATVGRLVEEGKIPLMAWRRSLTETLDDEPTRILVEASLSGDKRQLRKSKKRAEPNRPGPAGLTALTWLVALEDEQAVTRLIEAGADPNAPDAKGNRPLAIASTLTTLGPMRALLDHGASTVGADGTSVLQETMKEGCVSAAILLVDRGVSPKELELQGMFDAGAWSTMGSWLEQGLIEDIDTIAAAAETAALNEPHCDRSRAFLQTMAERGAKLPTDAWALTKTMATPACFPAVYQPSLAKEPGFAQP